MLANLLSGLLRRASLPASPAPQAQPRPPILPPSRALSLPPPPRLPPELEAARAAYRDHAKRTMGSPSDFIATLRREVLALEAEHVSLAATLRDLQQ